MLGVSCLLCRFYYIFMKILLANNVGPDQKPHDMASDLGLHCLPKGSFKEFPGKNGFIMKTHTSSTTLERSVMKNIVNKDSENWKNNFVF